MAAGEPLLEFDAEALLAHAAVQRALASFAALEPWIRQLQLEITRIPGPTGLEGQRSEWMLKRFRELGAGECEVDEVGNVIAALPGTDVRGGDILLVSAHMDTVFPPRTELQATFAGGVLRGPGISDNGAGLAALLALLRCIRDCGLRTERDVLFAANVGEEGEGNLKGMRHIFEKHPRRDRIRRVIAIDGPGTDHATTQALASRRLRVSFRGPGGHSWSDFGTPSAVHALARAAHRLIQNLNSDVPSPKPNQAEESRDEGRRSFNIGVIEGGSSINSIAAQAAMRIDLRSVRAEELSQMTAAVREAVAAALAEENSIAADRGARVTAQVHTIGDRPAGELPADSKLALALAEVDRLLGIQTRTQRSSTDANIPLSLGREAVAVGAGGRGGGNHTVEEWFDPANRDLGLRRILLLTLALSGFTGAAGNG
jgi:tripeptide aminopeptidase